PVLSIFRPSTNVILSWTNSPSGFYLESKSDLSPAGWGLVSLTPTLANDTLSVTLPITGTRNLFRLTTQPRPALNARVLGSAIVLTWPTNITGFTLQSSTSLLSTNWTTATPSSVVVNGQNTVKIGRASCRE